MIMSSWKALRGMKAPSGVCDRLTGPAQGSRWICDSLAHLTVVHVDGLLSPDFRPAPGDGINIKTFS